VLATGTTQEAAQRIGMASATLRVHLHRVSQKLGAGSRLEAISLALAAGLINPPAPEAPPRGCPEP
jgi:DNA-binding CsgD family transcriptional regulator